MSSDDRKSTSSFSMALATIAYCLRNMVSARRTDNFVVHVEPDEDASGNPRYSLDTSTQLGHNLLKELSNTPSSKSTIKYAKQLTQTFLQKYPGLASIKIQLGDNMVQSFGATPTEVNVCKKKMPGVRKVKVRNSGTVIHVKCNKAISRTSQVLTVELGDRHGNWWECFKDDWTVEDKPLKGVCVTLHGESLKKADYIVLQCLSDGLGEALCLPAVAVIHPFSLRLWQFGQLKNASKQGCRLHNRMTQQKLVLQSTPTTPTAVQAL